MISNYAKCAEGRDAHSGIEPQISGPKLKFTFRLLEIRYGGFSDVQNTNYHRVLA